MFKLLRLNLLLTLLLMQIFTFASNGQQVTRQAPPPPERRNGEFPFPGLSIENYLPLLFLLAIVVGFYFLINKPKKLA